MTVAEVQDRFTECFPNLTIAFYQKAHKQFAPSDDRYLYKGAERIGNIRSNHNQGAFEIKSWYSVARVEKELKEKYGLHAQVFRVAPDGQAVQTTLSDAFTLKEQNDLALEEGGGLDSAF